jgi:hypothetical protein
MPDSSDPRTPLPPAPRAAPEPFAPPISPTRFPEDPRKKGRFSGKRRLKRSRLIWISSTSTWAKSVLTVTSRVRLGVTLYLRSPPISPSRMVPSAVVKSRWTSPSTYGAILRLR